MYAQTYETHCLEQDQAAEEFMQPCACCETASVSLAASEGEDFEPRYIPEIGHVCLTCWLREVESQEVA
jgi:hypothetical protein